MGNSYLCTTWSPTFANFNKGPSSSSLWIVYLQIGFGISYAIVNGVIGLKYARIYFIWNKIEDYHAIRMPENVQKVKNKNPIVKMYFLALIHFLGINL